MKRTPALTAAVLAALALAAPLRAQQDVTRYVRYAAMGDTAWGVIEGQTIRQLSGDPIFGGRPTSTTYPMGHVVLLAPATPKKIIAVGLNYQSHLGERPAATEPGLFIKLPSAVVGPGDDIVRPEGADNLHYEGEMVLVIGKRAKDVSKEDALGYVFGVTAGDDVSERDWQAHDLQWFRAKTSDTFAPLGPMLVTGLNPDDLLVETRLNGELRQSQRTRELIFDVPTIVSYVSRYVTLEPGDVIYTGTPGATRAMADGDVVEVSVEGVGTLRNTVRSATEALGPGR